jgi:hypothetical protein
LAARKDQEPSEENKLAGDGLIRTRLNVIAMLLLVVISLLGCQLWVAISGRSVPEQWQYTIAAPSDETLASTLDRFGADGWELVTARRASDGNPLLAKMSYEMIFKRRGAARDPASAVKQTEAPSKGTR